VFRGLLLTTAFPVEARGLVSLCFVCFGVFERVVLGLIALAALVVLTFAR
jgi:hypothetical protein